MPDPYANARFFIRLAEEGKSFAPHTPKRYEDRIALLRHIVWRCNQSVWFSCSYDTRGPKGELVITGQGSEILHYTYPPCKAFQPSPLARLRLFWYFYALVDGTKDRYLLKWLG